MIPLGDDNPTRTTPYVVYGLVALNVLVYLIDVLGPPTLAGGVRFGGTLWNYSMVPYSVVHNVPTMMREQVPVVLSNGMRGLMQITQVHQGLSPQWLTIFTSMFLHGGLLHIGGNMLYLWIFGNNIEDTLGHVKFALFYLLCGVIAALTHIMLNVNSIVPTVGASGAIAGVLGAYLILYPQARIRTLVMFGFFWNYVAIPAVFVLGIWFVIQLVGLGGTGGELGGGVAYGAHVGGFIAGVAIIWLLGGKNLKRQVFRRPPQSPYRRPDDRPYPFRPWR